MDKKVREAADSVASAATDAVETVGDAAEDAVGRVADYVGLDENKAKEWFPYVVGTVVIVAVASAVATYTGWFRGKK